MLKEIKVLSRTEAKKLSQSEVSNNTAIISFYDPVTKRTPKGYHKVDYSGICDRVFYVQVHDIDLEILGDFGLTYDTYFPEASALAAFIVEALAECEVLVCQCEYGQSRSAACAAAVKEFVDGTGIEIFADYRYYPNQLIFNKLLNELKKRRDETESTAQHTMLN